MGFAYKSEYGTLDSLRSKLDLRTQHVTFPSSIPAAVSFNFK